MKKSISVLVMLIVLSTCFITTVSALTSNYSFEFEVSLSGRSNGISYNLSSGNLAVSGSWRAGYPMGTNNVNSPLIPVTMQLITWEWWSVLDRQVDSLTLPSARIYAYNQYSSYASYTGNMTVPSTGKYYLRFSSQLDGIIKTGSGTLVQN